MIDKELELQIKRVKEFMQLWIKFHDMYKNSLSREAISPEDEKTFLETKSLIARKYQALKTLLGTSVSYDDRALDVVSHVLSLKGVADISDVSMRKIENDWHNSYIQLNKLLGELEGRQDNLQKISRLGLFANRLRQNAVFNLIVIIAIIVAIYIFVNRAQKEYQREDVYQTEGREVEKEGKIEFK
jgi:hypothetical protein